MCKVHDPQNMITDELIRNVALGPLRRVETWHTCYVNGYKFHTNAWSEGKSTMNSGVCIRGTDYGQSEYDYYGILKEIVEIEFPGRPIKRVVLFNVEWFDPTPNRGTRIHKHYGIVDVRCRGRYRKFDPFIIAQQAEQVYFASYPEGIRQRQDWYVVIKTTARRTISGRSKQVDDAFQADAVTIQPVAGDTDQMASLVDDEAELEEIDEQSTMQMIDDLNDEEHFDEDDDEDEEEEIESDDSETEEESEEYDDLEDD